MILTGFVSSCVSCCSWEDVWSLCKDQSRPSGDRGITLAHFWILLCFNQDLQPLVVQRVWLSSCTECWTAGISEVGQMISDDLHAIRQITSNSCSVTRVRWREHWLMILDLDAKYLHQPLNKCQNSQKLAASTLQFFFLLTFVNRSAP